MFEGEPVLASQKADLGMQMATTVAPPQMYMQSNPAYGANPMQPNFGFQQGPPQYQTHMTMGSAVPAGGASPSAPKF